MSQPDSYLTSMHHEKIPGSEAKKSAEGDGRTAQMS